MKPFGLKKQQRVKKDPVKESQKEENIDVTDPHCEVLWWNRESIKRPKKSRRESCRGSEMPRVKVCI